MREEKCLQQEPLGNESVEGRQRRNRHCADQERKGRHGHSMNQTAEMFHVAGVRGVQHRAGAEEQQRFEHGVVDGVIQARDQRQRR